MNNKFQYGGMAVLEGIMMRGPVQTALAVRKSDGTIHLEVAITALKAVLQDKENNGGQDTEGLIASS